MNTALATKQLYDSTHRPIPRVLMCYEYDEAKYAKLIRLDKTEGKAKLMKTILWASLHGVEITLRPV